jgi:hypothetical protein
MKTIKMILFLFVILLGFSLLGLFWGDLEKVITPNVPAKKSEIISTEETETAGTILFDGKYHIARGRDDYVKVSEYFDYYVCASNFKSFEEEDVALNIYWSIETFKPDKMNISLVDWGYPELFENNYAGKNFSGLIEMMRYTDEQPDTVLYFVNTAEEEFHSAISEVMLLPSTDYVYLKRYGDPNWYCFRHKTLIRKGHLYMCVELHTYGNYVLLFHWCYIGGGKYESLGLINSPEKLLLVHQPLSYEGFLQKVQSYNEHQP